MARLHTAANAGTTGVTTEKGFGKVGNRRVAARRAPPGRESALAYHLNRADRKESQ